MKKIIIFYATYGGGHLSAARSIKECLEENYSNIEVKLIDFMEYINKIVNTVTTKAYSEMAKKVPRAWGKLYADSEKGPIAHISTTSNKLMSIKLNKLLTDFNPDLIISTHPFSSQMCGYLKKHGKLNCKTATVITDHASHDQWLVFHQFIDYFFVSHEDMRQDLISKGLSPEKIFATGIPISKRFLLEYDKNEILQDFALSNDKKTVLFFGGGEFGLGKTQTFNIFKALAQSPQNLQIVAISGRNQKMKDNFVNFVLENNMQNRIRIFEFTNKVPELMSIADLVVTKPGGLTTTESLASGLPIIVINPIPGQEEENALFLEKNGAAIWLKNEDNVEKVLEDLFSTPLRLQNMKKCALSLAKRNSTKDICKILLEN